MDKIKAFFKNMPLLVSFMLFLLPSVILATVIAISGNPYFYDKAMRLLYSYNETTEDGTLLYSAAELIEVLPLQDKIYYYVFIILSHAMWVIPILISVIVVPYIFYTLKIKKPMQIMLDSAEKISNENLDFMIDYDAKDEMGELCAAFEKMRFTLEKNNKETWRILEERKKLNAIFAHDLRTPLTVLHGYSDYLLKYVPEEKVTKEKLLKTIGTMNQHIVRIENYVQHMNTIQKFEDIQVKRKPVSFLSLVESLQENTKMMKQKQKIEFRVLADNRRIAIDEHLVHQVFENLISNAIEYANYQILIICDLKENLLSLTVSDDGIGFLKEDLPTVTQPFYRSDKDFTKQHFGLGLYTSKKICEKHGGELILDNNKRGGASITASFQFKS